MGSAPQMTPAPRRFNPFPGLRPFEPNEDHLFFGRERHTDELVRRLRHNRFVAVVGGSGSGKSSLVRSGLIPALHGGQMARAGSSWRIALVRPGEDPIGRLARALSDTTVLGQASLPPETNRAIVEATLRSSPRGLVDVVNQAHLPESDNVLVVVDQFEELFRFRSSRTGPARDDAVAFVKVLLAAAGERDSAYIVITMRADFIGNCMDYPGLPEAISDGQYLIPRMTRDELRRAITGPVAVGGGAITPRLVTRLLNDVGDDPNLLPVLQHALMRAWDYRYRAGGAGPIDVEHYDNDEIGTIRRALSYHAEEAYRELGTPDKQALARSFFQALTEVDAEGRAVRRPSSLAQLTAIIGGSQAAVVEVIDCFRRPGRAFLTPAMDASEDLRPEKIIDLSHESLIRVWERLNEWVRDEAEAGVFYRRTLDCAQQYKAKRGGLLRGAQLALAHEWFQKGGHNAAWAERHGDDFEFTRAFVRRSRIVDVVRKSLLLAAMAAAAVVYFFVQRNNYRILQNANAALAKSNDDLKSQIGVTRTSNTQAAAELGSLTVRNRKLEADYDTVRAESDRRGVELKQLAAARDDLLRERRELEARRSGHAAEVARVQSSVDGLIERVARLRDVNRVSKARLDGVLMENARLNAALRSVGIEPPRSRGGPPPPPPAPAASIQIAPGDVIPGAVPDVSAAEKRLTRLSEENRRLRQEATTLKRESAALSFDLDVIRAENAALEREIAAVTAEERKLAAQAEQIKAEIAQLRPVVARLRREVKALVDRLVDLRKRESDLQFQLTSLRTENGVLSSRIEATAAENDNWDDLLNAAKRKAAEK